LGSPAGAGCLLPGRKVIIDGNLELAPQLLGLFKSRMLCCNGRKLRLLKIVC
jgi:hypothetical protein